MITDLYAAVQKHDFPKVKTLISNGADVNSKNSSLLLKNWTPLHRASFDGCLQIVILLVTSGAKIDVYDGAGETPFFKAIIKGHEEISLFLISSGASFNYYCNEITPLYKSVFNKQLDVTKALLTAGANVNLTSSSKWLKDWTPLHKAIENNDDQAVRLLIDFGADVNALRDKFYSPLYEAIGQKNMALIKMLLDKGAIVNDQKALHRCIEIGTYEPADLLISNGASLKNSTTRELESALYYCGRGGEYGRVFSLFLKAGLDYKMTDQNGDLIIFKEFDEKEIYGGVTRSISDRDKNIIQAFVDGGIDVNITDRKGQTMLHKLAVRQPKDKHEAESILQIAQILIDNGINVDVSDNELHTPAWLATNKFNFYFTEFLQENGANVKKVWLETAMKRLEAIKESERKRKMIEGAFFIGTKLLSMHQQRRKTQQDMKKGLVNIPSNSHYINMESELNQYSNERGIDFDIEPSGSRGPDIVGVNNDMVGEIKHKTELDRDVKGYWSQWNSPRSFGGKTPDYKLKNEFGDDVEKLSPTTKGFIASMYGQLRGYSKGRGTNEGLFVHEGNEQYKNNVNEAITFLEAQNKISVKGDRVIGDTRFVEIKYKA